MILSKLWYLAQVFIYGDEGSHNRQIKIVEKKEERVELVETEQEVKPTKG